MSWSQRDIMTVREMIDAAIVFEDCNPIVDFKMIESIFYIMARHLNVLERQIKVFLKSKKPKKPKKTLAITEIKIHTKDKKSGKGNIGKSGRSRSTRRSVHRTTSEDSDDGPYIKKRGRSRSRSKSRSHSKKRKRRFSTAGYRQTETDEDGEPRSRPRSKSKSKGRRRVQKQGLAGSDEDEDDGGSKPRSKSKQKKPGTATGGRPGRGQGLAGSDEDEDDGGSKPRSKSKQKKPGTATGGRPGRGQGLAGSDEDVDDGGSKPRSKSKQKKHDTATGGRPGRGQKLAAPDEDDEDEDGRSRPSSKAKQKQTDTASGGRRGPGQKLAAPDEDDEDEDGRSRPSSKAKQKQTDTARGGRRGPGQKLAAPDEDDEDEDGRSRPSSKAKQKQTDTARGGRRGPGQVRYVPDEESGPGSKSKQPKAGEGGTAQKDTKRGKGQIQKGKDGKGRDDSAASSDVGIREKVLVVSRSSSEITYMSKDFTPAVTEDQFRTMVEKVRQLQEAFGVTKVATGAKPQKIYLEKSTSLTDPRAALNMAARLDVAEKTLTEMLKVVEMLSHKLGVVDADSMVHIDPEALENESSKSDVTAGSRSPPKTPRTQISEKISIQVVDEEALKEEGEIATWQQLTLGLTDFQTAFQRDLHNCVTEVADTATKAKTMLQSFDPLMKEFQLINTKFVKIQILTDQFVNKVTLLDAEQTMQLSLCHEDMLQTQYDMDAMLEQIEDICSHPQEDPIAVASTKDEFATFLNQIEIARDNQNLLGESHVACAADMQIYWKKLDIIREIKTLREEVNEALKDKASISDLNGLLSIEEFSAVTGYLQQEILTTNEHIHAGEIVWQKLIHDLVVELHDKATNDQIHTLTNSINMVVRTMDSYLEQVLDIVGPYRKNIFKKKLDRDGNCLACGSPANVELSKGYMGVVEQMVAEKEEEVPTKKKPGKKPCIPGLPIPHPLDPRSLFCRRICGARIDEQEIGEKNLGVEIHDIDPGRPVDVKSEIEFNLPCSPCNENRIIYFK